MYPVLQGPATGGLCLFSFESRRDGWRIIGLGMASFFAIFPLCAWRHLEIIESDLYERSQAVLDEVGIAGVEISMHGRDLSLAGAMDRGELDEVVHALQDVDGIRRITYRDAQIGDQAGD